MSQKWVKDRAADVRTTWTYHERRQRAIAGEVRCRELLARLGLLNPYRILSAAPSGRGDR